MKENLDPELIERISKSLERKLKRIPTKEEIEKKYEQLFSFITSPDLRESIRKLGESVQKVLSKYESSLDRDFPTIQDKFRFNPNIEDFWDYIKKNYSNDELDEIPHSDPKIHFKRYALAVKEELKFYEIDKYLIESIINKSLIYALYEEYGYEFEGESEQDWLERWMDKLETLKPINIERSYKKNNNFHLILTILKEVQKTRPRVKNFAEFVKNRFGIKNYSTNINRYVEIDESRHVSNRRSKPTILNGHISQYSRIDIPIPHEHRDKIKEIIKKYDKKNN